VEELINGVWNDLKDKVSREELVFLRKCFRAYSSRSHMKNVVDDLAVMQKYSPPPQKILDFGCGIGLQAFLLAHLGYDVYGLETVEDKSLDGFLKGKAESHIKSREESMRGVWETIRKKARLHFQFYDGRNIPFPDNHFDIVLAYAVFEHIPPAEIPDIVKGIYRILKAGGTLYVFQLPQRASYTEFVARKLGMESHEYLWSFPQIEKILTARGYKIKWSSRADMLINHPYKLINPLFPILRAVNELLLHTPLAYFAHHLTVVAEKI
jgi:SAM-dependent methyltransferase